MLSRLLPSTLLALLIAASAAANELQTLREATERWIEVRNSPKGDWKAHTKAATTKTPRLQSPHPEPQGANSQTDLDRSASHAAIEALTRPTPRPPDRGEAQAGCLRESCPSHPEGGGATAKLPSSQPGIGALSKGFRPIGISITPIKQ